MTVGLLLIHAFPLDARMWEGQRLGPHTVAPDLPGFGMAPPVGGPLTMAAAATRCLEAADTASRPDRRPRLGEHAGHGRHSGGGAGAP